MNVKMKYFSPNHQVTINEKIDKNTNKLTSILILFDELTEKFPDASITNATYDKNTDTLTIDFVNRRTKLFETVLNLLHGKEAVK